MIKSDISAYSYSRLHAEELQNQYREFFFDSITLEKIISFSKTVGISIYLISHTSLTGRLEINDFETKIIVNKALSSNGQIRIITHEIGHWFLRMYYPEINANQPLDWREKYADNFSYEMCIPVNLRSQILKRLLEATTAMALVDVKHYFKLKIPFYNILRVMTSYLSQEIKNDSEEDKIWILAKWKTNRKTNLEPKLRILTTLYNQNHFFIAENQGLGRVIDNIEWLSHLPVGISQPCRNKITIFVRQKNRKPEYIKSTFTCHSSAVRLHESQIEQVSDIIILCTINKNQSNI